MRIGVKSKQGLRQNVEQDANSVVVMIRSTFITLKPVVTVGRIPKKTPNFSANAVMCRCLMVTFKAAMMESEVTRNCHASFGERDRETRTV